MCNCEYCYNARLDDDLTDDNDMSSITIGESVDGFRMMFTSGNGQPPRIEFDKRNNVAKMWFTKGVYFPKYCPECGRKITEYD